MTIPETSRELLSRAENLAGLNLAQIFSRAEIQLPKNLLHHKGYIGQTLEKILGAHAKSEPKPDFPHLGIELKTIPIDKGKPLESTYVCIVNYFTISQETWQTSLVKRKLQHVLWIPIIGAKSIPLHERIVGMPTLWQPSVLQEKILQQDWEEAVLLMTCGNLSDISAKFGTYLQVRPKAANAKSLTQALDSSGKIIKTLPRGFYLRPHFTAQIIKDAFIFT